MSSGFGPETIILSISQVVDYLFAAKTCLVPASFTNKFISYLATFELLARLASNEHDPQLELTDDK